MLGMIQNLSLRVDQGGTAMAQRHQRGWLKKETRRNGETWVLFYRTIRKSDGKRVENKIAIGLVRDFPEKSHAWAEVERLHLPINQVNSRRGVTFGDLAQHYAEHELVDQTESIHAKAIRKRCRRCFAIATLSSHFSSTRMQSAGIAWPQRGRCSPRFSATRRTKAD